MADCAAAGGERAWRDPVRSVRSLRESYRPVVGKEDSRSEAQHARRRHTPEQIIRKLREADRLLGEGQEVAAVAKQLEVSEQTLHRWRVQYGGLKAEDAKRLKELERENARLKRIVADQLLENQALKGDREGKLVSPSRRREAVTMLVERLRVSERRACQITGQHRSTQRHARRRGGERDDALRDRLRELSAEHPRWG